MENLAEEMGKLIIQHGPGILIAVVMLWMGYRIASGVGLKIVAALEKPSSALFDQAQSMDRLTSALHDYVSRDTAEHREIIVLQKIVIEKIENLQLESAKVLNEMGRQKTLIEKIEKLQTQEEKDDGTQKREV